MKGVVFTSFLDMVEERYGLDMVDTMIESCNLKSKGAYTSVGNYECSEIIQQISVLSVQTYIPVPQLLKDFGCYLFSKLVQTYPKFEQVANNAFEFLEKIKNFIHFEIQKLYPDAELPNFEVYRPACSSGELHMVYSSARYFEDLCEGLICGCCAHFQCSVQISRQTLFDNRELFILKL